MKRILIVFCLSVLPGAVFGQQQIQERAFRDFLNFQDVCQNEHHLKEEYCDKLWKQYRAYAPKEPSQVVVQVQTPERIIETKTVRIPYVIEKDQDEQDENDDDDLAQNTEER